MAPITIFYGRRDAAGVVADEQSLGHAVLTSEGNAYWFLLPIPPPIPAKPQLYLTLPEGYDLVGSVGLPPAEYAGGWVRQGLSREYTFRPAFVRPIRHETPWYTTILAMPTIGTNDVEALEIRYGRYDDAGNVVGDVQEVADAVVTTEGDVYWIMVELPQPDTDGPTMFVELPVGFELIAATGLGTALYHEPWQRQGLTNVFTYSPPVVRGPGRFSTPWITNLLGRPQVVDITIGTNGYCTVGDVIRASDVRDAARLDVIAFIHNGFDHINAQFNIGSVQLNLVPPITDRNLIDALKRLNIDFAVARVLFSRNDRELGETFISRFDRNLDKMVGKLTSGQGAISASPARTVYGG